MYSSVFPQTIKKTAKLLVVDDIYDNLLVVESVLEDEGYEIILEQDSKKGLNLVEKLLPDLILLDVMMPEIDGYEFTRQVRSNHKLPFIPILLITAHDRSNVVSGLDAGADDFIRKPVDPDELQARVRSLLRLKQSIDERDRMADLRQDFVSRFTHDLKIPLAASNRVLKLMGEGRFCEATPELEEIVDNIIKSNDDLLSMVKNLLELYRHEAGCKNFNFSQSDIAELINEVVQQLSALAEEKGLNISFENKAEDSHTTIDRVEFKRVFTNLIGNAIKFTDSGCVNVYLCEEENNNIAIKIQDTGSGMSEQEVSVLFERFRQGKNKNSGSGLGLYLSRCIVEAHQGRIDVSSQVGKGSTFTVNIPKQIES